MKHVSRRLTLAEKTSGNITHICLFQLVIFAAVAVDTHVDESVNNILRWEAHIYEAVYEVFAVPLVAVVNLAPLAQSLHYS